MWFRVFLTGCSLAGVALFGWIASHTSFHKVVLGRYSVGYFTLLVVVAAGSAATVVMQFAPFYKRVYRLRREIVLTLSACLALPLAAEIAIRALDPFGISHFEERSQSLSAHIPDPVLVYKLPSRSQGELQGVTVSTNELGLRDRAIEPKRERELRILLLGDSITFGLGVTIEATFGRKLESILSSRLGRPVRTVNAGVGGYNTVQAYGLLKTHVAAIQPDVVTLLYVPNDIELADPSFDPTPKPVRGTSPPQVLGYLLENSWLYRLGNFTIRHPYTKPSDSFDRKARGVRESMDALARIATACRERRMAFAVFFYRPMRPSAPDAFFMDELFAEVSQVGYNYGFRVTDTASWWGDADVRNSVVDWPNEQGHEILATGMAHHLMRNERVLKASDVSLKLGGG